MKGKRGPPDAGGLWDTLLGQTVRDIATPFNKLPAWIRVSIVVSAIPLAYFLHPTGDAIGERLARTFLGDDASSKQASQPLTNPSPTKSFSEEPCEWRKPADGEIVDDTFAAVAECADLEDELVFVGLRDIYPSDDLLADPPDERRVWVQCSGTIRKGTVSCQPFPCIDNGRYSLLLLRPNNLSVRDDYDRHLLRYSENGTSVGELRAQMTEIATAITVSAGQSPERSLQCGLPLAQPTPTSPR